VRHAGAMTRYALDAASLLRLLDDDRSVADGHSLVAPALVRSDVLAALYADVRAGRRSETDGRARLERLAECRIRLLGDRVSRATAWRIATAAEADDIAVAEYVAVASLQADALVASDPEIRALAGETVTLADYDDLFR
jgi:hypothetical protein